MNVGFCVNKLALIGLGPALLSLVRNCPDAGQLSVYILCSDLSRNDKENINKLLSGEAFPGKCILIDFDPKAHFGSFRSLHGDWTPYGRLLLPDLVNEELILYLDCDIIVEANVLEASDINMDNYALGAVESGSIRYSLEHKFLVDELHIPPDSVVFNSGVLLFNLSKWRKENLKEKCLAFAAKYPNKLLSCDQTILNALYAGDFAFLPPDFNCAWYANSDKPSVSDNMILHFVGSPKPWDLFGRYFHKGYHTWKQYLTPEWKKAYGKMSVKEIKRFWKIRRSYLNAIKRFFKTNGLAFVCRTTRFQQKKATRAYA